MNHKRPFFPNGTGAEEIKPAFRVVLAYDSRTAGARAMNVFSGLVREFGDEFEFHCGLWRFDVLELPEARQAAVIEGAAADLIIVATRCDTDLPPPVASWLGQCLAEKRPASACLVALLERRPAFDSFDRETRQHLQQIADRAGLDFFCYEVRSRQTSLRSTSLEDRANTVSSVLDGILNRQEKPPRWRM